jgi:predicted MFS family arabinose efflux permease
MVLSGVSKTGNDTSQSAWIAHQVPFERRGRVLGLTELTWGGAFLLGIPACAWLTDRWDWRAPFVVIGVALVAGGAWLWAVTPDERAEEPPPHVPWHRWRPPSGSLGLFGFALLQPFAQMMVFAVAGDWFVTSLGMSLSGLGINTALLGVGEVVGTLTSAWAADRIGKRVAAMAGVAILVPGCAVMGLVGDRAVFGVVLLVIVAVGFELSWVSALPLFTEVAPERRAAMLGAISPVSTPSRAVTSAVS